MADGEDSGRKFQYSPVISLGNIIQAISLAVFIGGGALTSYIALRTDISAVGERSAREITGVTSRVIILEARREFDERYQTEMRANMVRLLDIVTDLRIQVGGMASKKDGQQQGAVAMPAKP
jgi:hypothetical protein